MAEFQVDPSVLDTVVDRMTDFEQQLEARLAQVSADQQALGAAWDGTAGQAQAAAQQEWLDGAQEMRRALADLRRIATGARENYDGAVATNMRNWA